MLPCVCCMHILSLSLPLLYIMRKPVFIVVILTIVYNNLHTTTNAQTCNPGRPIIGQWVPPGRCDPSNPDCCKFRQPYPTYDCSPPVTLDTKAEMILNSFERGRDKGGPGPTTCDGWFHSDNSSLVALSTGWFNRGSRCGKEIVIRGNGKITMAKVVDECDSRRGCDPWHGYKLPCKNNVVGASKTVWSKLGISPNSSQYGNVQITWSDVK